MVASNYLCCKIWMIRLPLPLSEHAFFSSCFFLFLASFFSIKSEVVEKGGLGRRKYANNRITFLENIFCFVCTALCVRFLSIYCRMYLFVILMLFILILHFKRLYEHFLKVFFHKLEKFH